MIVYCHQRKPLEADMADDKQEQIKQAEIDYLGRKLGDIERGIASLFITLGIILGFQYLCMVLGTGTYWAYSGRRRSLRGTRVD